LPPQPGHGCLGYVQYPEDRRDLLMKRGQVRRAHLVDRNFSLEIGGVLEGK